MARERQGGGKLLPFFLGMLMGIILLIGGLAGAGFYLYKQPVGKTVNLVDKFVPDNLYATIFGDEETVGFLDPSYADKKASELIQDIADAANALSGESTLNDVNKISPKVKPLVAKFLDKLSAYGITTNEEELMSIPIKELGDSLIDSIEDAPLATLLEAIGDGAPITDDVMLSLCYGAPTHYTMGEDNKPIMSQIHYLWHENEDGEGAKLYDVDGHVVEGYDSVNHTITIQENETTTVYYLSTTEFTQEPIASTIDVADEIYYAYTDTEFTQPVYYPITKVGELKGDANTLINRLYLSDALNVNNESHKVLIRLAYGSEENYTVLEDGTIKPNDWYSPRTIGELRTLGSDLIDEIYLMDALGIDGSSHKIFRSLACGVEGVDYDIVDKTDKNGNPIKVIEMKEGKTARTLKDLTDGSASLIDGIYLSDVLAEDQSSAITMYLLYGKEGIHYQIVDGKAKPLPKRILNVSGSTAVYNGYGEVMEGYSISGTTLTFTDAENPSNDKTYTLEKQTGVSQNVVAGADVYYVSLGDGKYESYHATTLGDLNSGSLLANVKTRLTLKDVMGDVSDNIFLKHVQDETIANLPSAISKLTVMAVYEKELYQTYDKDTNGTDTSGHTLTKGDYIDSDGNFICSATDFDNLSETDKARLVLKGTWKYLLTNPATKQIEDCAITKLDTLISNMKENMQAATLNDMNADGLINLSPDTLNTELIKETTVTVSSLPVGVDVKGFKDNEDTTTIDERESYYNKNTLGELTINEMLTYVGNVLDAVDGFKALINNAI